MTEQERKTLREVVAEMEGFLRATGDFQAHAPEDNLSRDAVRVRVRFWIQRIEDVVETG